jgi:hypothetical protein
MSSHRLKLIFRTKKNCKKNYVRLLTTILKPLCRRTYLTILNRAWSANFKMVWYILLRPLRLELDGQDPFQICGRLCQTRKTPTLGSPTMHNCLGNLQFFSQFFFRKKIEPWNIIHNSLNRVAMRHYFWIP